jgi:hypothetical protein
MSTLLNYPAPDYGADERGSWAHGIVRAGGGEIIKVRSRRRTAPAWLVTLGWRRMAYDLATFEASLAALRDGFYTAYFYTPSFWRRWLAVPAGVGDGSTLTFPFGGTSVASSPAALVYIDGVSQATDWSIAAKGGDSLSRYQITFGGGHAPALGAVVTVAFTGRRLLLGRLAGDVGRNAPAWGQLAMAVGLEGEEADGVLTGGGGL